MSTRIPKRGVAKPMKASVPEASAPSRYTNEERQAWIATAAYYLSKRRQAAGDPPDELRDWLDAEREVECSPASHQQRNEDRA